MTFVKTMRDDFQTKQPASEKKETPLRTAVEKSVEQMESERRARRQKIRDRIAADEAAVWKHSQAANDLAQWEEKRSQISMSYRETVEPLEVELGEIEREQTHSRTDELADRRGELLDQIRAAKAERDRALASYEDEWSRLERLRIVLAKKVPTGGQPTEEDLLVDADKTLLARFALAKHDCKAAIERLDLIQDKNLNSSPEDIAAAIEQVEIASMVRRRCFENAIAEG